MKVYRVGHLKYAHDLSGEGARLFGGRWNHKGIPCVYTAQSRSLALLEYSVNIDIYNVPRALTIAIIEIPDNAIKIVSEAQLPGNWKHAPAPFETKKFGSELFKQEEFSVFQIPSTTIPEEFNFLINPRHPDSRQFKLLEIKDFVYDLNIKSEVKE